MEDKEAPKSNRAQAALRRRTMIVEAAAACFISKGFHQSSMRDIANMAAVSLGNLYNHFESKADLIVGLAEIEAEENQALIELLGKPGPCLKILRNFTDKYFKAIGDPGQASLIAEIFAEAMRNKDIYDIFDRNHQRLTEALVACLERGRQCGDVEEAAVSMETAAQLLDLIESAALRVAMAQPTWAQRKSTKKELHRLIEKIVCP